jgi:hypothetical protein
VSSIPGAEDDFATTTHGLRVGRHHADSTKIMENILSSNSFSANAGLGEGYVFGDVLAQMVANHEHVEMFIESVSSIRSSRIR